MNKNKNTRRKMLLMAASVALVATISVGATLAYLTAQTTPVDNKFTAAGDVSGRTYEPSWTAANALNIAPGKTLDKDPRVDNETGDMYIWVGSKLSFQIDIGNGYKDVTYAVFSHFVDVCTGTTEISSSGGIGTGWVEYTAADDGLIDTTNNKYYFYTVALNPDTDGATAEASLTATKANDNTTPIFTKVTPKKEILIDPTNGEDADLSATKFKQFNFKIFVNSYGTKAYKTNSSETGAVTQAAAKAEILTQLGGK